MEVTNLSDGDMELLDGYLHKLTKEGGLQRFVYPPFGVDFPANQADSIEIEVKNMTRYLVFDFVIFLFNLMDQKKRKKGEGRQKAHRPTPEGWPVTKTTVQLVVLLRFERWRYWLVVSSEVIFVAFP